MGWEGMCGDEGRGGKTNDLKGVIDDPDGHQLLAIVAPIHHQGVCQALDDGALGFAETFHGVAAGGVGDVDWGADLDIISVQKFQMLARILVSARIMPTELRTPRTSRVFPPSCTVQLCELLNGMDSRQTDISDFDIVVGPFVE